MPYMIAVAALVGVLSLLDLVLTLGVARRLREHAELRALEGTYAALFGRQASAYVDDLAARR